MSGRYVVCFEPALANLDEMGNRMANRLESQLLDFLDAWRPEAAFEKRLQSHLWQFKWSPRHGSGARAFPAYFDGDAHDIALILVAFKKTNESKFNAKQPVFNERSKEYVGTVLGEKSSRQVADWIGRQRERTDRAIYSTVESD